MSTYILRNITPATVDPSVPHLTTLPQLQARIMRGLMEIKLPDGEVALSERDARSLTFGNTGFAHYYNLHYMPRDGSGLPDNSPLFDFAAKAVPVFAAVCDPSDSRPVTMRQVLDIFYEQKILMEQRHSVKSVILNATFLMALMLNQRCSIPGREAVVPSRHAAMEYISTALGKMLLNGEEKRLLIAAYVGCHPKIALGSIRDMTNCQMKSAIVAKKGLLAARAEACQTSPPLLPNLSPQEFLRRLRPAGKAARA